jgi:hypothetical protein
MDVASDQKVPALRSGRWIPAYAGMTMKLQE